MAQCQSAKGQSGMFCHKFLMGKEVEQSTEAERIAKVAQSCAKTPSLQQTPVRIPKFHSCAASLWHCSFPALIEVLPGTSPKSQQFICSETGTSKANT